MMRKKAVWVLALSLIVVLFAGTAYLIYSPRWVYEVTMNGESVGFVSSLDEYRQILTEVLNSTEEQWDCELVMNEEVQVTRTKVWAPELSPAAVKAGIAEAATYITSGWAIMVNDEPVALVHSQAAALDLVQQVKDSYLPKSSKRKLVSAQIQENIRIVKTPADPGDLLDSEEVLALFLSGAEETATYTVKKGDTLSGIARSYSMPIDRLRDANSLSSDNLKIGQVLTLEDSSTLLHVKTVEEMTVSETIPRPVKYQENPDMSVRGDKVIQAGTDGSRTVTYRLELINGAEVKRTELAQTVTSQPDTKIIMPGIGYWPASPTGMFRFPLNYGRVSSPFGNRRNGFHRGIDIAAERGTPIYAAASGTVRIRTYSSSYGYYIVIDHDNGYSTLYAHATALSDSVRVGSNVVRGQVIAWVGSTGFSTGPHLHWEVSRSGTLINPLNFFD